jgi:hypothetical protein
MDMMQDVTLHCLGELDGSYKNSMHCFVWGSDIHV